MAKQDFKHYPDLRSAAILTASYVAATDIDNVELHNQLVLLIDFTKGSLTTAEIKVDFESAPGTAPQFQESVVATTGGTGAVSAHEYQFSATGKYRIMIPIKDRYIRISAKGTGTVTGSSMTINAVTGVI